MFSKGLLEYSGTLAQKSKSKNRNQNLNMNH